jgi:hypothetical protein
MSLSEIANDIQSVEADRALHEACNFSRRTEAIDFLDFHVIERIETLQANAPATEELNDLMLRAERIKFELENVDNNLFFLLRKEIKQGVYKEVAFMQMLNKYTAFKINNDKITQEPGYDNLDIFINSLLFHQSLPEATVERTSEMVFYQQTPARIILELIAFADLKESDVFFDIGAGLGLVTILVSLIAQTTVKGVEYEPAYCNYAKACAKQLNLNNIEFINADARNADYADGTVFFMYTPFMGNMLQEMLDILQAEAQKRAIRIFTYGPCSAVVAREEWLASVNEMGDDLYTLYEFRSRVRRH